MLIGSFKFQIWLILLLFVTAISQAQYKRRGETLQTHGGSNSKSSKSDYTIPQFAGKWQEFERRNRKDSSVVPFNDSIQLKFMDSNRVMTKTSIESSLSMVGDVEIEDGNLLTVAADDYTVKSLKNNNLILDDDENFIHYLKKVDSFWYEKLGRIAVKQENFTTPISTTMSRLVGNWFIYRRLAKPGAVDPNTWLIKYLNIQAKKSETEGIGEISCYRMETSQQIPCTITLKGTTLQITAKSLNWKFSVYQADGKNLVFGGEELLYYSKPLQDN